MGYGYGKNSRGVRSLACDGCGTCDDVKLRSCTYTVLTASKGTIDGQRARRGYCKPSALCAECLAAAGGDEGLHADCRAGARAAQAKADAVEALLDAGELLVVSATNMGPDWVKVTFRGRNGQRTDLVRTSEYDPVLRPSFSQYATVKAS